MADMKDRKKRSDAEIELDLLKDSNNRDAWETPIAVPSSKAPRPSWYGQIKHLELAAKFYVLSVLHRLGAEGILTYAQPDNVDIAALLQSGEALTIDVKTLTGTSLWPVEKFRARKHHFLVFVYIWKSETLKKFIKSQKTTSVSLEDLATKLDPTVAWEQFASDLQS